MGDGITTLANLKPTVGDVVLDTKLGSYQKKNEAFTNTSNLGEIAYTGTLSSESLEISSYNNRTSGKSYSKVSAGSLGMVYHDIQHEYGFSLNNTNRGLCVRQEELKNTLPNTWETCYRAGAIRNRKFRLNYSNAKETIYNAELILPEEDGTLATEEWVTKRMPSPYPGWIATQTISNKPISVSGDDILHTGRASCTIYERTDDSSKKMWKILVETEGDEIMSPEPVKIASLTTAAVTWKGAAMPLKEVMTTLGLELSGIKDMSVDRVVWKRDQTGGSVGLLDGTGAISGHQYEVRDENGYITFASFWGRAIQFSKTNSSSNLTIRGKVIELTLYN